MYQQRVEAFLGWCKVRELVWTSGLDLDRMLVVYFDELFFNQGSQRGDGVFDFGSAAVLLALSSAPAPAKCRAPP